MYPFIKRKRIIGCISDEESETILIELKKKVDINKISLLQICNYFEYGCLFSSLELKIQKLIYEIDNYPAVKSSFLNFISSIILFISIIIFALALLLW